MAREDDDGNRRDAELRGEPLEDVEAVHARQPQADEAEIFLIPTGIYDKVFPF